MRFKSVALLTINMKCAVQRKGAPPAHNNGNIMELHYIRIGLIQIGGDLQKGPAVRWLRR
jgi:hypothetical protein